jgi:hypothetical protein
LEGILIDKNITINIIVIGSALSRADPGTEVL